MLLKIADVNIEVPYEFLEDAKRHCHDYEVSPAEAEDAASIVVRDDICELGEQLPLFNRMIVHGVAVAVKRNSSENENEDEKENEYEDEEEDVNGNGFIFTAASGTGKSTHAFLWQRLLGEDRVDIINGDKPIVEMVEQRVSGGFDVSCFKVWGSPWCGKEGLQKNIGVPLKGIVLLSRLDSEHPKPQIARATREEWRDFMMEQTYLPENPIALTRTFQMLEYIYNNVRAYRLYADMSKECIELCVRTLNET